MPNLWSADTALSDDWVNMRGMQGRRKKPAGRRKAMTPSFKTISQVIARIESSNDQFAIRFEPMVYKRINKLPILDRIKKIHHCSEDTADMIYSCSFGDYQIMGFNLYGKLGYSGTIFDFIESIEGQVHFFSMFLSSIGFPSGPDFDDQASLEKFARTYNGPGNVGVYVSALTNAYNDIQE